jgi:drug/metabolite transporter (DMT)-like permease
MNWKKVILTVAALIGLPFVISRSSEKGGIPAVVVFLCLYAAAFLGVYQKFDKKIN